jgi:hypothetical protein
VTLQIDPNLLSPVSALLGAIVGGGASMVAAIYTQRCQDRLQRVAREVDKREAVYAEFVMHAANLLLNAYTCDEIELGGDEQRMIGLINRMRMFAPPDIVGGAERVLRVIVEISLKPSIEIRQLAKEALSKSLDPDPLVASAQCAGPTWTTCAEPWCEASALGSKPTRIQPVCVGDRNWESSGNSLCRL